MFTRNPLFSAAIYLMAVTAENSEGSSSAHRVIPNVDPNVELKEFTYRFKKDKLGNVPRPTVKLTVPVPNAQGIVAILEKGGKELDLLNEAIYDTMRSAIAGPVSDDETISDENFDRSKWTWEAIANQDRADRRSSNISAEDWEAFAKDYIEVMPGVTNKKVENVTAATIVYAKKFSIVKTNKPVLKQLQEQLALYMNSSKNAEQFVEILDLLNRKVEVYLKSDEAQQLIDAL